MKVFKTYLFFTDFETGTPFLVDTIHYENSLWLVASWLQSHETAERLPERLVSLSKLSYVEVDSPDYQYLLHNPIPKSVFDGQAQDGYEVLNYPQPLDTLNNSVH